MTGPRDEPSRVPDVRNRNLPELRDRGVQHDHEDEDGDDEL